MSITVTLPGVLAKLAGGETSLQAEGATVSEVVSNLASRYPRPRTTPEGRQWQSV